MSYNTSSSHPKGLSQKTNIEPFYRQFIVQWMLLTCNLICRGDRSKMQGEQPCPVTLTTWSRMLRTTSKCFLDSPNLDPTYVREYLLNKIRSGVTPPLNPIMIIGYTAGASRIDLQDFKYFHSLSLHGVWTPTWSDSSLLRHQPVSPCAERATKRTG